MLFLRSAAALVLATLLQLLLQSLSPVLGISPVLVVDLLLVVVVWIAVASGPIAGQLVGMAAGFIADGLAGGLFGLQAIANTLVGYTAALARQSVMLRRSVLTLIFAAAAALQQLVIVLLRFLFLSEPELPTLSSVLLRIVSTAALGTLLLAVEGRTRSGWRVWQRRRSSRLR